MIGKLINVSAPLSFLTFKTANVLTVETCKYGTNKPQLVSHAQKISHSFPMVHVKLAPQILIMMKI